MVYELRRRILDFDLYSQDDAVGFCKILFDKKYGHEQIVAYLDPLVRRFTSEMEEEEKGGTTHSDEAVRKRLLISC